MFFLSSPATSMVASAKSDVYSILFRQIKSLVIETDKHTQAACKHSGSIVHSQGHNTEGELLLVKYNLSCIRVTEIPFKPFHNAIIVIIIKSSST